MDARQARRSKRVIAWFSTVCVGSEAEETCIRTFASTLLRIPKFVEYLKTISEFCANVVSRDA